MTSAANLYNSVIQDVIANVRDAFQDEVVDERVLMELKALWESKLAASKTIEETPKATQPAPPVAAPVASVSAQQQRQLQQPSAAASAPPSEPASQIIVTDPSRLMPVQITIPAQAGQPNSAPRALTVHVPAHALSNQASGNILQQVLTTAIAQALNRSDPAQAAAYLQSQINAAFRIGM